MNVIGPAVPAIIATRQPCKVCWTLPIPGQIYGAFITHACSRSAIAKSFFTLGEAAVLGALPIEERPSAFFRCWTRKEAYLKATGQGLSAPLDLFDVAFYSEQQADILKIEWDQFEAKRWLLRNLNADPAYAAALAVEAPPFRLQGWQWP